MVEEKQETSELLKPFKAGDIVEGTVIGIGRSAVYLDLGPQGTGIIFGRGYASARGASGTYFCRGTRRATCAVDS